MTSISVSISDLFAGLALVVALWSLKQTHSFNKRQNSFAETAEKLNLLLIEQQEGQSKFQRQADLGASSYKAGNGSYRIKVFNKGIFPARNVRLNILSGGDVVIKSEIDTKFPFPVMERHQHTEIMCAVHLQSSRRVHLKLTWDDEAGTDRNKEVWVDIF